MNTTQIRLTRGLVATVDVEDADLAAFKWSASPSRGNWYAMRSSGEPRSMHRLIAARAGLAINGAAVDHANGNGLDNRRSNLRIASAAENAQNQRRLARNKSGYKGVSWDRERGKWQAHIEAFGKNKRLGRFKTAEEAYLAYVRAAQKLHGEFARFA